jgi:GNAT superfamily N-acetyltransferase
MRIEPASEHHVAALAGAHAASAGRAYANIFPASAAPPTAAELTADWLAMIVDPVSSVWAARIEDAVVGGVAIRPEDDVPAGLLLARLYVHPDHWRRGYGSALHDHALAAAAARSGLLNLWVLEHNHRARRMYERRGWTLIPGRHLANDPPRVRDVLYQRGLAP